MSTVTVGTVYRTPRPDTGEREAFEVELARSGRTVLVPADRSILETLEGTPDHRDSLLTPAERETGDVMMICVSRARGGRLVLDL